MCQRQQREVCQKRNIARVKYGENVIYYFEKGCFSAVLWLVNRLKRTDEIVFSDVGKQLPHGSDF